MSLIDFIGARKWLVELIAAAVIVAGGWWLCEHLIGVGVQRQKDADAAELVALQRKADIETARLQERATLAEHAHDQELTDLRKYRADNPLHGRLCGKQGSSGVPAASTSLALDAYTSPAARNFLAMPEGDSSGNGDNADQLHLLDLLAAAGDSVSAGLREYQAR